MALYTTDTHSLVWHFTSSSKLSQRARDCFGEVESGFSTAFVPVIVMAEVFHIARKKRIDFDYYEFLHKIIISPNYLLHPFDCEILAKLGELEALSELHDQIIVATTMLTSSVLITKDANITNSGLVEVIW